MNIYFRFGSKFMFENVLTKNIKRGLYSTSFNADIVPLINLHLAKQKDKLKNKPKSVSKQSD